MKQKCVVIVLILMMLLCGCTSKQTNSFVEGVFTNDEYKLIVTEIDEETFNSKNGINVVEDKSVNRKSQYYEIVLYKLGDENEGDVELTFEHLTFSTVTSAEPCYYTDINGNGIGPQTFENKIQYCIDFNKNTIIIGEEKNDSKYSDVHCYVRFVSFCSNEF